MPLYEMTVDKMFGDEMTVDKMYDNEMPLEKCLQTKCMKMK